jgi:serine/threonine protein kinase
LKGLSFIPQRIAHGYDPATGWYAIVVEHEKSRSLRIFIDRHSNRLHRHYETSADVESALEPVLMILNSVAIVHDKGVVHGDLKPAHVFLRPASSEAVLIDWGLARKNDEPLSEERRSGSWIHAPPERADINVVTSAGTHQDLYAVGVMLLELATDLNFEERPRFLVDHFFSMAACHQQPSLSCCCVRIGNGRHRSSRGPSVRGKMSPAMRTTAMRASAPWHRILSASATARHHAAFNCATGRAS